MAQGPHCQSLLSSERMPKGRFRSMLNQEVIKGLAGLLIVDDDEVARLPLPSRWGVDDIPLIIQDRRFTPDGQFFDRMNIVAVTAAVRQRGQRAAYPGTAGGTARREPRLSRN